MTAETARRRSRWMLRALEWNDPRARYPNLWVDGMPVQILAFDTVAMRLRLGDLIAVFKPGPKSATGKKGTFAGLSRVIGLRRSYMDGQYWVDLEVTHKLKKPLAPDRVPRRVFLCCDPEWPGPDVELFDQLFDAAVAEGWKPGPGEGMESPAEDVKAKARKDVAGKSADEQQTTPVETSETSAPPVTPVDIDGRLFGGVELGAGLRDARDESWMAVVRLLEGDNAGLEVVRLEPTGRTGMALNLKSPDSMLSRVEGFGMGFPFALPEEFVKSIHGGTYPENGWWGLAGYIEKTRYPEFLVKVQEYGREHGEALRYTDEKTGSGSPLRRVNPDLGSVAYHGVRMLAEERSRYAIRPFESAQGRYLFEVRAPLALVGLSEESLVDRRGWGHIIQDKLQSIDELPVKLDAPFLKPCRSSGAALKAVLAARQAAVAVLSGNLERTPEELDPEGAAKIVREGWIY